jgi:lipoprotein-releasing system permease protein
MLAERTARYEKGSRSTVMMRLASVTVGLGIAVMIITLSVVAGFREQINGALRGMMADMTICDVSGLMRQESEAVVPSAEFVAEVGAIKGVRSVAPQVTLNGMAKSGDNVAGLQIKGIDQHYDTAWWQSVLLEGALPDFEAEHRGKELLLSEATARKLDVAVGDKVEMLFAVGDERPRRDRFKVSGIFRTGLEEMDLRMAVGDVRDVRRIVGWADDEVSGYDVMLSEDAAADEVSEAIFKIIDSRYDAGDKSVGSLVASSLSERFPVVFDWETVSSDTARTNNIETEDLCQAANTFCNTIADAGYIPMVYCNQNVSMVYYELSRIQAFDFWYAEYKDQPTFYYNFDIWQYSDSAKLDGVPNANIDVNISFVDYSRLNP